MKAKILIMAIVFGICVMSVLSLTGCDNGESDGVVITQAEYNEIQKGMTYDHVVDIIGSSEYRSDEPYGPPPGAPPLYSKNCYWQNESSHPPAGAVISFDLGGHVIAKQMYGTLP